MVKRLFHLLILLLTLFFWKGFAESANEVEEIEVRLEKLEEGYGTMEEIREVEKELTAVKGERLVMGLMLTIFSCAAAGIFVAVYLIPFLADRATHAIFDSGEMVEKDALREAHSLLAQGEFEKAFGAFRKVAEEDPANRLPWVEMAKIQRFNLHDPNSAADTLREALEAHEWSEDDAAFLLFRLADVYDEDLEDRPTARAIMQQVSETFPDTRHSANATHKLHEWDREDEEQAVMDHLHGKDSDGNPMA